VFQLKTHPPLTKLGSFREGWFYVQDPSTVLAVQALDPQPGDTVLDLCAAPGGKTTYIAQGLGNEGQIVSQDAAAARLDALRENCARLGVTCVRPQLAGEPMRFQFDRVLVDAPCTNTGVMRRRVDLRWRIRPEELARLQATQLELLDQAAPQLKPGGRLVYSTCSLEPEENREVVEGFVSNYPAFELLRDREVTPFTDQVDGAYVAVLRKNS